VTPAALVLVRHFRFGRVAVRGLLRVGYQAHVQPEGLRLGHPWPRRRHGPHGLPTDHQLLHDRLLQHLHPVRRLHSPLLNGSLHALPNLRQRLLLAASCSSQTPSVALILNLVAQLTVDQKQEVLRAIQEMLQG